MSTDIGVSEEVAVFAVRVEKMLCAALDREWSATGISIATLCADIERIHEAAEHVYSPWSCGEPLGQEMRELGRALGYKDEAAG